MASRGNVRKKLFRPSTGLKVTTVFTAALFFAGILAFAQENPTLGEFTLTATGDSMLMTPPSVRQNDPQFMGVVKAIRQGDAAFTNIEEMYASPRSYPAATSGNTYMTADPSMLKELQWIGFNLFGAVNNHSYDYGLQGVLDTLANLKANGAVYAGIGETLGEAREPHYLATSHGRVAILATTSTFLEAAPAGDPRPDLRGRPGINPLHYQTVYNVDAASFAALKKISDQLQLPGSNRAGAQTVTIPQQESDPNGQNARIVFQQSDKPGVVTTADASDVAAMTRSIKDARQMANYVIMSIHAHEGLPGPDGNSKPAQFLEQFAHAAIDAGADVFVGHGPQQLRGIEIYKGNVIFYSLGGLFYQDNIVRVEPYDFYHRYGLGPDARPSEGYDTRGGLLAGTSGSLDDPHNESVVAKVIFHDRKPVQVVLTPITISVDRRPDYGIPRLADPQMANKILTYLQKLSQPYGTNIVIKDGIGTITIEQSHR
jgi:poly-gamma-glutamate capsule biosynthesis protein CapA/YwtB (metallophosphatase superfamily)